MAVDSQGLEALLDALDRHQAHLRATGELARRERERLAHELESRLRDHLLAELRDRLGPLALDAALDQVAAREKDTGSVARELAAQALRL